MADVQIRQIVLGFQVLSHEGGRQALIAKSALYLIVGPRRMRRLPMHWHVIAGYVLLAEMACYLQKRRFEYFVLCRHCRVDPTTHHLILS